VDKMERLNRISAVLISIISICFAFAFLLYGFVVSGSLTRKSAASPYAKKIGYVAVSLSAAFALSAAVLLFSVTNSDSASANPLLYNGLYFGFDQIGLSVLLILFLNSVSGACNPHQDQISATDASGFRKSSVAPSRVVVSEWKTASAGKYSMDDQKPQLADHDDDDEDSSSESESESELSGGTAVAPARSSAPPIVKSAFGSASDNESDSEEMAVGNRGKAKSAALNSFGSAGGVIGGIAGGTVNGCSAGTDSGSSSSPRSRSTSEKATTGSSAAAKARPPPAATTAVEAAKKAEALAQHGQKHNRGAEGREKSFFE